MPWIAAGAGTPHSPHTVGSRSTLLDRRSTVLAGTDHAGQAQQERGA